MKESIHTLSGPRGQNRVSTPCTIDGERSFTFIPVSREEDDPVNHKMLRYNFAANTSAILILSIG